MKASTVIDLEGQTNQWSHATRRFREWPVSPPPQGVPASLLGKGTGLSKRLPSTLDAALPPPLMLARLLKCDCAISPPRTSSPIGTRFTGSLGTMPTVPDAGLTAIWVD
ncbi:unnamed protein product [Dicrocoelium dendriticum]|nr:unnamed protein product [Dicrocoelium dendriticum]